MKRLLYEKIVAAAKKCLSKSWPFAVVYTPESTESRFYAAEKTLRTEDLHDNRNCFVVSTFGLEESQNPKGIPADFSIERILSDESGSSIFTETDVMKMSDERTTSFREYDEVIGRVTGELAGKTGKTVISRMIIERADTDPFEVADIYFRSFPKCFRAIYFTPEVGLWIVATPELLLDYDYGKESLRTMSLAGTRKRGDNLWDEKNRKEHELVTRYIVGTLEKTGMAVTVGPNENLPFGAIEHLCNRIEAQGKIEPVDIALKLSPTPAVCGWPKEKAYMTIVTAERHKRSCYGAFIGIVDQASSRLYVNLRCCKVEKCPDSDEYRYLLFAGGGINDMSETAKEWEESANKIKPFQTAILKNEKELNVGYNLGI